MEIAEILKSLKNGLLSRRVLEEITEFVWRSWSHSGVREQQTLCTSFEIINDSAAWSHLPGWWIHEPLISYPIWNYTSSSSTLSLGLHPRVVWIYPVPVGSWVCFHVCGDAQDLLSFTGPGWRTCHGKWKWRVKRTIEVLLHSAVFSYNGAPLKRLVKQWLYSLSLADIQKRNLSAKENLVF